MSASVKMLLQVVNADMKHAITYNKSYMYILHHKFSESSTITSLYTQFFEFHKTRGTHV